MNDYLIEACVDSVSGALAAQAGGARRIELCANLSIGGTTPSAGAIQLARQAVNIPIHVMIRPRSGDFLYDQMDLDEMALDIRYAKDHGAAGVVLGVLTPDAAIAVGATEHLCNVARPMAITFHRAFDQAHDPYEALDALIELGIERVLTSGQAPTAEAGMPLIAELVRRADGRISVMPGSGINASNIVQIAQVTGARELHLSGRVTIDSPMRVHNELVHMGNLTATSDSARQVTSAARIAACVRALARH